jgi:hypothetical protein
MFELVVCELNDLCRWGNLSFSDVSTFDHSFEIGKTRWTLVVVDNDVVVVPVVVESKKCYLNLQQFSTDIFLLVLVCLAFGLV